MGGGGKVAGEDEGGSKGPSNYVQGSCPGSAPVWEKNMGGCGRNDDSPGGFPISDCKMDCRDDGA